MRLIELSFADGDRVQPLLKATLKTEPLDHRLTEPDDRGRRLLRLVFKDGDGQKALDAIQAIMEDEADWRLVVLPVEASLPKVDESPDQAAKAKRTLALREELYDDIAKGARLNADFLLLTALSTLVVVFGLSADNIAAVIGAMVIAPLLGADPGVFLRQRLGRFADDGARGPHGDVRFGAWSRAQLRDRPRLRAESDV
jgi:hypothetical protein